MNTKNKKKFLYIIILIILICTSCSKPIISKYSNSIIETELTDSHTNKPSIGIIPDYIKNARVENINDSLVNIWYQSKALENNALLYTNEKEIFVYLPPSYYTSEKHYPVVYYLHGFTEGFGRFVADTASLDIAMTRENAKEFILVEIDGSNPLGGTFYISSQANGDCETNITQEIVNIIDYNFRTIENSSSRGICGFSMGGFGALYLGLKYPDVYSSVLTYCPAIINEKKLKTAYTIFDNMQLTTAIGAAFSPDLNIEYPYAQIPIFNNSENDKKIIDNWKNGLGNWGDKVDSYLSQDKRLQAIEIHYSNDDYFAFIPKGVKSLAKTFDKKNIDYTIFEMGRGHNFPVNHIDDVFVSFFVENLVFE